MTNELKNAIIENGKVIKSWSRWTGTGYKTSVVEFDGKTFEIRFNCHDQHNGFFHSVEECVDPRPAQKVFFKRALQISKEDNIPVEVVMALGVANSEMTYFDNVIDGIKKSYLKDYIHELTECGIGRRKSATKEVIKKALENSDVSEVYYFDNLVDGYNQKIDAMGQVNSLRIASFLAEQISKVESWEF